VALRNLRAAYPEANEAWRKEILGKLYEHIAWSVAEYFALQKNPKEVLHWFSPGKGVDLLDDYAARKKGLIVLTAHWGNWELLAGWLVGRGYPLHSIVRRHDDPAMEEMIEAHRRRVGLITISKNEHMKKVVNLLQKGAFVGILADQKASPVEGITVPFFGIPSLTYVGAAALGLLAGVPVVPVASWRKAPFRHEVVADAPLCVPQGMPRRESIVKMTEEANLRIEKFVRQHPEQWLWLHRRWDF
jgi:KDO2-lipid IV(A) lauroyltransferase